MQPADIGDWQCALPRRRHEWVAIDGCMVRDIANAIAILVRSRIIGPIIANGPAIPEVPSCRVIAVSTIEDEAVPGDRRVPCTQNHVRAVVIVSDQAIHDAVVTGILEQNATFIPQDVATVDRSLLYRVEVDTGLRRTFDNAVAYDEILRCVLNADAKACA